jgi:hypothetical protein
VLLGTSGSLVPFFGKSEQQLLAIGNLWPATLSGV